MNDIIQAITNLNKIKPNNRILPVTGGENISLTLPIAVKVEFVETKRPKDTAKITYYAQVWKITETNAPNVPNFELRGKDYHIDHIIPISYGYKNSIDPSIIGGIDNLQILSHRARYETR